MAARTVKITQMNVDKHKLEVKIEYTYKSVVFTDRIPITEDFAEDEIKKRSLIEF